MGKETRRLELSRRSEVGSIAFAFCFAVAALAYLLGSWLFGKPSWSDPGTFFLAMILLLEFGALGFLTLRGYRLRRGTAFCWDEVAMWLERDGQTEWRIEWSDYCGFRLHKSMIMGGWSYHLSAQSSEAPVDLCLPQEGSAHFTIKRLLQLMLPTGGFEPELLAPRKPNAVWSVSAAVGAAYAPENDGNRLLSAVMVLVLAALFAAVWLGQLSHSRRLLAAEDLKLEVQGDDFWLLADGKRAPATLSKSIATLQNAGPLQSRLVKVTSELGSYSFDFSKIVAALT